MIIFSDFKDYPAKEIKNIIESIDLKNIAVFLIWSDTNVQQDGAQSKKLSNQFKKFAQQRNALDIKIYSLNSILNDSNAVKNFQIHLLKYQKISQWPKKLFSRPGRVKNCFRFFINNWNNLLIWTSVLF